MADVQVLLTGGPAGLPEDQRVCNVNDLNEKVKLRFGTGYEHFIYSGQSRSIDGREIPVFHWAGKTKIAE